MWGPSLAAVPFLCFPFEPSCVYEYVFPISISELSLILLFSSSVNHSQRRLAEPFPKAVLLLKASFQCRLPSLESLADMSCNCGAERSLFYSSSLAWMFAQGFAENLGYYSFHLGRNQKLLFWWEEFFFPLGFYKSQLSVIISKNWRQKQRCITTWLMIPSTVIPAFPCSWGSWC